ncbi:MAG: hypothetical protein JWN04_227 [Myxococcaceae bacterium]|nr:hypothetical protein [Myxococcaceae bacterium]
MGEAGEREVGNFGTGRGSLGPLRSPPPILSARPSDEAPAPGVERSHNQHVDLSALREVVVEASPSPVLPSTWSVST